jgi:hypothetical protein
MVAALPLPRLRQPLPDDAPDLRTLKVGPRTRPREAEQRRAPRPGPPICPSFPARSGGPKPARCADHPNRMRAGLAAPRVTDRGADLTDGGRAETPHREWGRRASLPGGRQACSLALRDHPRLTRSSWMALLYPSQIDISVAVALDGDWWSRSSATPPEPRRLNAGSGARRQGRRATDLDHSGRVSPSQISAGTASTPSRRSSTRPSRRSPGQAGQAGRRSWTGHCPHLAVLSLPSTTGTVARQAQPSSATSGASRARPADRRPVRRCSPAPGSPAPGVLSRLGWGPGWCTPARTGAPIMGRQANRTLRDLAGTWQVPARSGWAARAAAAPVTKGTNVVDDPMTTPG